MKEYKFLGFRWTVYELDELPPWNPVNSGLPATWDEEKSRLFLALMQKRGARAAEIHRLYWAGANDRDVLRWYAELDRPEYGGDLIREAEAYFDAPERRESRDRERYRQYDGWERFWIRLGAFFRDPLMPVDFPPEGGVIYHFRVRKR